MARKVCGFLIVFFLSICSVLAQFDNEQAYLETNFEFLNPDSLCDLVNFANEKTGFKFYLTGERHDHKGDYRIQLTLFSDLIRKGLVNTLLLENGHSGEFLLKKFLELPDTALEKNPYTNLLFHNHRKDFEDYYLPLYQLYHELPANKKFELKGIDIELNLKQAFRTLSYMLNFESHSDSLLFLASKLADKGAHSNGHRRQFKMANLLDTLFTQNKTLFADSLSEFFNDFSTIMVGMKAGQSWLEDIDTSNVQLAFEERESFMFEKIREILAQNPKATCFGQLGLAHILDYRDLWMDKVKDWKSLAWRIEHELNIPVCRTAIFYPKLLNRKVKYSAIQQEYESLFTEFAKEDLVLFNLNKANSPFRKNGRPIHREYCKSFTGKDYPVEISLEFNYVILNNYFDF